MMGEFIVDIARFEKSMAAEAVGIGDQRPAKPVFRLILQAAATAERSPRGPLGRPRTYP